MTKLFSAIIFVLFIAACGPAVTGTPQANPSQAAAVKSERQAANDAALIKGLTGDVRTSIQNTFDTDPAYAPLHLHITDLSVLHEQANDYKGLATVTTPTSTPHQVLVHITCNGPDFMWNTDPGAFLWALDS